ncbi:DUF397 domain-containing protein [Actinomadura harenae]|uniref:DUF397 domain-containing protein n=1 Tax=Actinomadura harenae TaxID=2483351 RepID=A0A3M2LRZ7_9ACTN|nr:DUF397 domain-containing protein [Actinomadura harenae]RMI38895.1 DUF397 domain-containing protein [Actinomadura harenae]
MRDGRFRESSALVWRKSSHSTAQGEECVEVTSLSQDTIGVRDSKDPEGPRLTLTPAAWRALAHRTKTL